MFVESEKVLSASIMSEIIIKKQIEPLSIHFLQWSPIFNHADSISN